MFKLDNFRVILLVSFSYKKLLQCSFYESLKKRCKNGNFQDGFYRVFALRVAKLQSVIENQKRSFGKKASLIFKSDIAISNKSGFIEKAI